jgi:Domain of unknown function (DUF1905)/Bacteriocin-protection, YdeI or OmpD-Associated
MKAAKGVISFEAVLEKLSDEFGWHYVAVSRQVSEAFGFTGNARRVVCTLNGTVTYQCALMPKDGNFFILVNKKHRDRLGIIVGDTVRVELVRDESKYGLPMPDELREVLDQDPDGDRLFHTLTAGKQRTMLYYIGKWKDVDRRIQYALTVVEHLKRNDGKIIFKELGDELKRPML